ncbi:MAG: HprK-related kinase B [Phycisphaerales bacterium]|nr:HprK-related kinase B [Phycisphaerales bacterium]
MRLRGATIAELAAQLRETRPSQARVVLRLEDCEAIIDTNSDELAQRLSDYWRAFVVPAPTDRPSIQIAAIETGDVGCDLAFRPFPASPGKTRVKDAYCDLADGRVTRKPATGMMGLLSADESVVFGPCAANLNQVINFVNNRYMQRLVDAGGLVCHAAAFTRSGTGAMLAGLSGRGKSTLTLRMLARGFDFVSNDRVIIRRDGELTLHGIPKSPRVNPGTLLNEPGLRGMLPGAEIARLQALAPDELWRLEEKNDVDVTAAFPGCAFQLGAAGRAVFLLAWERGDAAPPRAERVDLAESPELLAALTKSVGPHYYTKPGDMPPPIDDDAYLAMLAGCPVYAIRGGVGFDTAAAIIVGLMG